MWNNVTEYWDPSIDVWIELPTPSIICSKLMFSDANERWTWTKEELFYFYVLTFLESQNSIWSVKFQIKNKKIIFLYNWIKGKKMKF